MRRGTAVTACLLDYSKAFNKCKFDKLFHKRIAKGLPPVVVRVLIFMYEEQEGWVNLGGKKSSAFKLTNGTRQGSVLSPLLFSVYLDDLLVKLRDLKLQMVQVLCTDGYGSYGTLSPMPQSRYLNLGTIV